MGLSDIKLAGNITLGNVLSIAVTLASAGSIIVGGVWTARGLLDDMHAQTALLTQQIDAQAKEIDKVDRARRDGDKVLTDRLEGLVNRIDALFAAQGKRGEAAPEPWDDDGVHGKPPG